MMRPTIIATFLLAFFSLAASAADLGRVENQFFTIRDFALTNGAVMPEVKIAYETYQPVAEVPLWSAGVGGNGYDEGGKPVGRHCDEDDRGGLLCVDGQPIRERT